MVGLSAILLLVAVGACAAQVPIQPKNDFPPPPAVPATPVIQPKQSSCSGSYAFTSANQAATLQSVNYPGNYPSNLNCQYFFSSPAGTTMTVSCSNVNVPCSTDYLYFSLAGSSTFSDARVGYCGSNSASVATQQSTGNQLNVGFVSGTNSGTRRFVCTISVVPGSSSATTAAPTAAAPTTTAAPVPSGSGTTNSSCSCGVKFPQARIVGGTAAAPGEFPWRVMLFIYNPSTGSGGLCGGTIISPNWILTAAHCTMDFQPGYKINVYYNTTSNPVTTGSRAQTIVADRYVQNPGFNRNTLDGDFTLIHLPTPITYGTNVGPVCLPYSFQQPQTYQGFNVTASGYGTTQVVQAGATNNSPPSNTLQKVVLPVLTQTQCSPYYGGNQITPNMFCTFKPGQDTCQGDSGGSVDYQNPANGLWYNIGVTSFGAGCATQNYPGVYARVSNFLSWIEATTGETYCRK